MIGLNKVSKPSNYMVYWTTHQYVYNMNEHNLNHYYNK